jgi:hypothetical protein
MLIIKHQNLLSQMARGPFSLQRWKWGNGQRCQEGAEPGDITSGMSRWRKWGNEQTGLGGVGKIKVRLVDARTGPRGSDEEAHERVVLGHILNL